MMDSDTPLSNTLDFKSDLSRILTEPIFENAYNAFIKQAEINAETGKSNGSYTPYGFKERPNCDGARVSIHFGRGAASKTPYMNWWVVSIYYITENGNIILGIEEDRYPHLKQMSPFRYAWIGNKQTRVAVFYETNLKAINYHELYETFISVCEQVMHLGLF